MISEQAMKMLMSHFKVFPAIMDVVNGFGGQTSSESDSASECNSYTRNSISGKLLNLSQKIDILLCSILLICLQSSRT